MNIADQTEELIKKILEMMEADFNKITVKHDKENNTYHVNIDSDNPSLLIGYHGENIYAFQHILKVMLWKQTGRADFNILLDVDEYRKRQEENVINIAERKIELARNTNSNQTLPPMSPYFRRIVHMHLTKPDFEDITTESIGEGSQRQVVIKLK